MNHPMNHSHLEARAKASCQRFLLSRNSWEKYKLWAVIEDIAIEGLREFLEALLKLVMFLDNDGDERGKGRKNVKRNACRNVGRYLYSF